MQGNRLDAVIFALAELPGGQLIHIGDHSGCFYKIP
jgi:hypothetical protein